MKVRQAVCEVWQTGSVIRMAGRQCGNKVRQVVLEGWQTCSVEGRIGKQCVHGDKEYGRVGRQYEY